MEGAICGTCKPVDMCAVAAVAVLVCGPIMTEAPFSVRVHTKKKSNIH